MFLSSLRNKMGWMVDEMGKVSAMAQGLRSPITSAEMLINSDDVLYMMIEHNTSAYVLYNTYIFKCNVIVIAWCPDLFLQRMQPKLFFIIIKLFIICYLTKTIYIHFVHGRKEIAYMIHLRREKFINGTSEFNFY